MLNTLTWMKEEEVTPTSSTPLLETTSFDDYLNKISLSNPILSVNDAALQDDNIEINQEAVDIFTQPALQRIGLYSEEKKRNESLSFLDDEVKKEKYNEKQVTLSSMRLNNPEKYKELNETFDTDYLKRFEEQDLPEETGRLFNSMKDMFKDSNVIATPNGYATAFSILMEPQLKTGDQINREKSDFYYFQNDKDFRQKVLESVNNKDAKELLISSFKLYDKEVDPSESFFSSLFKNPNDTETFTRSIFQNLTPFIRQGLGLITKKSAGAVVAGSLGLTGTAASVASFGTGFLITAGIMAASGAVMQLEEKKKTTAQADVLDMLVKKRQGIYNDLQVQKAVTYRVLPDYIDPQTGQVLKEKLDADTKAGIKTSFVTPWFSSHDMHEWNAKGGGLLTPRRTASYTMTESFGDFTGEIIGSFALTGLQFATGGMKALVAGNTSVPYMLGALSFVSTQSIISNYSFDIMQGFLAPLILQNETIAKVADYSFLSKPLVFQMMAYVPNLVSHKLAGAVFGNVFSSSKVQQTKIAESIKAFNDIVSLNSKFASGIQDSNTTTKTLEGMHTKMNDLGAKGVNLSSIKDIKDFVRSGGFSKVLDVKNILDQGDKRLADIESTRDFRTLGSLKVVQENFGKEDIDFTKDLIQLDKNYTIEAPEVANIMYKIAEDMGDSTYSGSKDGSLIKKVNLKINAIDKDGNPAILNKNIEMSTDQLGLVLTKYFSNETTEGAIKDKITKLTDFSTNLSDLRNGVNLDKSIDFFVKMGFDESQIDKLKTGKFTNESIDSFNGVFSDGEIAGIKSHISLNYSTAAPSRARHGIVSVLKQHIFNILKFNNVEKNDPAHRLSTAVSIASSVASIVDNPVKLTELSEKTSGNSKNICTNVYKMLNGAFEALDAFKDEKLASGEDSNVFLKGSIEEFTKVKEEFQKLNPEFTDDFDVTSVAKMVDLYKSVAITLKANLLTDYGDVLSDIAKLSAIVKNPEKAASSLQPGEENIIISKLLVLKDFDTEVKPIIDSFAENGASSILNSLYKLKDTSVGDDPSIMARFNAFKTLGWDSNGTVNKTVLNLKNKYEALKEKFPDMFEDGNVNMEKLQEKLNSFVSLEEFTTRINMQVQARGYVSANPTDSSASLLSTLVKIKNLNNLIQEKTKNETDTTEDMDKLKSYFNELKYLMVLKGNGAGAASDFAFSLLNSVTGTRFGNKNARFLFTRLRGLRDANNNTANPFYSLLFGSTDAAVSAKDSAVLLGVDGRVRDAVQTGILKALNLNIDTEISDLTGKGNVILDILESSKVASLIKDLSNDESRKSFIELMNAIAPELNNRRNITIKESEFSKENKYIDYTKAYQDLVSLLGKNISETLSNAVKEKDGGDYAAYKEKLTELGIDTSKMTGDNINDKKLFDNMSAGYIKQLIKASGVTKQLESSIEGILRGELDSNNKSSEYLKNAAKEFLGEEFYDKVDKWSGDELVKNLTTVFMHDINKKQVFSAYEAFGFGSDNDSKITLKQMYDNLLDTTSNAPLKLLLTQFFSVDSQDARLKRLLADVAGGTEGSFSFVKKMSIINQSLEDYKEMITNFKNSPILAALPEILKDKLVSSVEYGFDAISKRITKFSEEYNKADSIKKEALLYSSADYFRNLSDVFNITSRVTKSFVSNMTETAKEKDGFLSDGDIAKALRMSLDTVNTLNIHSIKSALFSADNVLSDNTLLAKPYRMVRHTYLAMLNSDTMKSFRRNVTDPYYGLSETYKAMIKKLDNEKSDLMTEVNTANSLILNANDSKSIRDISQNTFKLITAEKDTVEEAKLLAWYKPVDSSKERTIQVMEAKKALISDVLGLDYNEAVDKLKVDTHYDFMESAQKAGILDIILEESTNFTASRDFINAQKLGKSDEGVTNLDKNWTDSLESKIRAKIGDSGLTEFKSSSQSKLGHNTNTVDAFNVATLMHSDFINNLMHNSIYNDKLFGLLKDTSPRMYEGIKQIRGTLKKVAGYGIMHGEIGAYEGAVTPMERLRSYILENDVSSREKLLNNPMYIQQIANHLNYYATVQDDVMLESMVSMLRAGKYNLSGAPKEIVKKAIIMDSIGGNIHIKLDSTSDVARVIARAAISASNKDTPTEGSDFLMWVLAKESGLNFEKQENGTYKLNDNAVTKKDGSKIKGHTIYTGSIDEVTDQFLKHNDIAITLRMDEASKNLKMLEQGVNSLIAKVSNEQTVTKSLNLDLLNKLKNSIVLEKKNSKGGTTKTYNLSFRQLVENLKNDYMLAKDKKATPEQMEKGAIYAALFAEVVEKDESIKNVNDLPLIDEVSSMYLLGEKIAIVLHRKDMGITVSLDDAIKATAGKLTPEIKEQYVNALREAADTFNVVDNKSSNTIHKTEIATVRSLNAILDESTSKVVVNGQTLPKATIELPTVDGKGRIIDLVAANLAHKDALASDDVRAISNTALFQKADIILTAVVDGELKYIPVSLKQDDYKYIDGSTTFWRTTVIKLLGKGILNKLRTTEGREELGIDKDSLKYKTDSDKKHASLRDQKLDEALGSQMKVILPNFIGVDENTFRQAFHEIMSVPAILRSFGALVDGTDFDATMRNAKSPFTEQGALEMFNRAFYYVKNNEHIYEMYQLYKLSEGESTNAKNAILKLADMVGIEKDLKNQDAIRNKVELTIAAELLANEKNSNPWMVGFLDALNNRDKTTNITKTYLERLLGVGVNNPNSSDSVVDIYKNFMQLGRNEDEQNAHTASSSIEDSIMESLVSGVYGSIIKLDPSFEPLMAFKKDPFTATNDTIKAMFDSVKLKEWAANIARDTGAIRVLDYAGVYTSPEDKEADKIAEENGNLKVVTLRDISKLGVVGNELIDIISKMPEVRASILDLMIQHEMKSSSTRITDPNEFMESSLNKFFGTFNAGKQLDTVKVGVSSDFWEEIMFMKQLYTPEVKGTGFGAKLLDSFQQLTSYFGVNFSGVVLITNHISWLRNLFGAYLQPALSLGSWKTGIQYSTRAISAIIAARKGDSAFSNKDVALYEEFLKYNPRKPLSLAHQGGQPFSVKSSKLDREKHYVFKTANTIVNKPMETINKGIFGAAAKMWGTDPHLLEANLRGAYGMIDDITKFAIWMAAKDGKVSAPEDWSGLAKMFNKNDSFAKSVAKVYSTDIVDTIKSNGKYLKAMNSEDAAMYANKFSFLYDGLPPAWSLVKNVWNPFASFTYNSFRIAHNSMKNYPVKVITTYMGIHLFNELLLKGQYGMHLDFGSFVPNMDAFSHLPFVGGRPDEFNITNPSAPFTRFFRMLMEQKDPFTGKSMENMNGLEQLVRAYTTSFVPVSPTLNAALRTSISLAKEGMGWNDTNIAKTGLAGTILSLMPESYIHKKMVEEGFMGRPIDKFGTTINPLFGILYGVLGLNFKLEDKAKSKLIVNQYKKTRRNLETQLENLKSTNMMKTNKDVQYEVTALESRLKALTERTIEAFDDVFGEVPQNIKDAYIGTSFNPIDYMSAAWTSVLRSAWETYGRSADYSVMRRY